MTEIITVTANPALDLSTEAPVVIPDRKLRCAPPLVHPGGGGVNISRAIHNLGGTSRALVAQGGPTGQELVNLIEAEGLTPESLGVAYPTRQSISVRDAATGLQYRFMLPGHAWTEHDAEAARAAILAAASPGALVIPSGSLPPGLPPTFFPDLAPALAERGARMILDTSGAALSHAAQARSGLYALRMDTVEAEELTGQRLRQLSDHADLARKLRADGAAEIVIVAAEASGNVIATEDWVGLTRPPLVIPHSKIGAGDSFVGAFALALSRGEDPVTACCWGTAAAASAVQEEGTTLCQREDVERFFKQVERIAL
ncbi:1-phosphofructokinase family hexose kinase [Jannaschia seohaensis]|uniref:Phosphofructokinase n=1 Tax=Jannaschia seohaensis TaxID=475081 RepID=A0A2Y9ATW7_9RHOB|nr:hexose kinase [Jannaschia seohaensis]PWJ18253.1 6-phosphofructokinase 2 [Jannaschia seohaensis]SSA46778.1 6-phosphofructokinase 2 [Jannaschia seohaensis]